MKALDIIKKIDNIGEEEINLIIERYEEGKISILTIEELYEMIEEDYDVSYVDYTEQIQEHHTHLVNDIYGDFWFASV